MINNNGSDTDEQIANYILNHSSNDFSDILSDDKRLEVAAALSDLAIGLVSWYPFEKNKNVMQINSCFGAFTEVLSQKCAQVTVAEPDILKAECTRKRFENNDNVSVINSYAEDISPDMHYDYIIYIIDQTETFACEDDYIRKINNIRNFLKSDGKLLLGIENKFGIKYFCGNTNIVSGRPFDGMTEEIPDHFRFSLSQFRDLLRKTGFKYTKIYYPLPDIYSVQLIYTDEYLPKDDLCERVNPYITDKTSRILNERKLYDDIAKNNVMPFFSNAFLAECGDTECCKVIYSAISSDRERTGIFSTSICSDDIVRKTAAYREGEKNIQRLMNNTSDMKKMGIPVLPLKSTPGTVQMRRVYAQTLSDHLRDIVSQNSSEFISCLDRLYEYILKSSEEALPEENALLRYDVTGDWGKILKTAYIEMIPVNCFFEDGEFLFFDQEYKRENYPAKYVMFRAIRDIYVFAPETEKYVKLSDMKIRFGLEKLWNVMQEEETRFQTQLRCYKKYSGVFQWSANDEKAINANRELIKINSIKQTKMFNSISELNGSRIILFGSGKMADYYLDKYGDTYAPVQIVDNNKEKWGTLKRGIEISSPEVLKSFIQGTYRIIIASNAYEDIAVQLNNMGIGEDSFRIFQKKIDDMLTMELCDTMSEDKYNIGYVTGAFDLFHIGHINILKNSKSRCHYLIAGVLTDEIIIDEKHKKPFIPFDERIEIVKQCKYVDRVVAIDKHNTNKIDAWNELRYGCLFSGSDHENEAYWIWLQKQLRTLGSQLEFFPYTKSTNSTMLQQLIRSSIKPEE